MNGESDIEVGMVSVLCTVYNHGKYLRKTLEGFVNQKVDFKYEILIHDDASKDDSADIIKEYYEKYPDIIRPIFQKENQYSKGVQIMHNLFKLARGEYIAICEGDDYWTDNNKLKIQYDYISKHKDCACVFHPVEYLKNEIVVCNDKHGDCERNFSIRELIRGGGGFQATCSLFFRSKYVKGDLPAFVRMADITDYPVQLLLGVSGNVHYIPRVMAKYRWINEGSWTNRMIDDKEKYLKHLYTLRSWLGEFNCYTTHKYGKDVAYVVVLSSLGMYLEGVYPAEKWNTIINELSVCDSNAVKWMICKHKLVRIIKRFPVLYMVLKGLKMRLTKMMS
ncbi:glycosyltransferase [Selenomonas sp. GACV-9]|uniref:glycosyltransferase family 2 protein n=1 Tax=Selenomonas sp. GACV-9 TaxID=3158782 RepID=UPI0015A506E5